jgi:hypothetical protein
MCNIMPAATAGERRGEAGSPLEEAWQSVWNADGILVMFSTFFIHLPLGVPCYY